MSNVEPHAPVDASWCFQDLSVRQKELLCLAFLEGLDLNLIPLPSSTQIDLNGRLSRLLAMDELDALTLVLTTVEELSLRELSLPEIGEIDSEEV